ncbi:hypothetical protein [Bradyrhizobium stylosanthis]|uniref:Tetratricopeptide repeat protein n=1 Tax=Bradyrhizobium stylosanthis TaxID=1803665 RepID=A0A560DP88_9BRAD|nr:hypothetical protein [Bradyrhizobium stylosanthis]TWA98934.1 hypothetical protein FBZ96_105613 [Bradyrhizobium stylosanthis]
MPDAPFSPQSEINEALLTSTLLGHALPSEAEHHLWEASLSYHVDDIAESHLRQAEALAPGHAAVLIGLFRFYFYKARLGEALQVAQRCIAKAAEVNSFSSDWRLVRASDAEFGRYESILPRFFLFSLKGYAYLQMRLGQIEEGRTAVQKLLELDPSDKIGAKGLLQVLKRMGRYDEW